MSGQEEREGAPEPYASSTPFRPAKPDPLLSSQDEVTAQARSRSETLHTRVQERRRARHEP